MAVDTPDFMSMTQLAAPVQLGTITQANGATTAVGNVNAIPFQTGWLVVFANNLIAFAGSHLVVSDNVSLQPYVDADIAIGDIPAVSFPVSGLASAVVRVTLSGLPNNAGAARAVAYVFGLFGVGVQAVVNSPLQPLYVKEVTDPFSNFIGGAVKSIAVAQNIAIGSSATLITGIVGQTIVVYGWSLDYGPSVVATLGLYVGFIEDTIGAVVLDELQFRSGSAAGMMSKNKTMWVPQGIQLPASAGVKLLTGAIAGGLDVYGAMYYTQAVV